MGLAVIVSNYGESYYRIRLLYDFTALDREIARLQQQQTDYYQKLFLAQRDLILVQDNCAVAGAALDAVIAQYIAGLIQKLNDLPPQIEPPEEIDPTTELPYEDSTLAFAKDLFDRVNDERGANALTRIDTLDAVAKNFLLYKSQTNTIGHFGAGYSTPEQRVLAKAYSAERVGECLSFGRTTAQDVVAEWLKYDSATLLDAEFTEAGCAYRFSPWHSFGYLWCMVLTKPGETPDTVSEESVVQEAVEELETGINQTPLPKEKEMTERLGKAASEYAKAVRARTAAENKITQMMAERLNRDARLAKLQALKTRLSTVELNAWSADYNGALPVGATIETVEIPGYFETGINIRPYGSSIPVQMPCGKLRPADSMTPELTFFNLAMEPGHLRWKPVWRYGSITDMGSGNGATVLLDEVQSREGDGLDALAIDPASPASILYNVPFRYLHCHEDAFEVGDAVLILFEGFNRDTPKIVGFKDHPRSCNGRISWRELWDQD